MIKFKQGEDLILEIQVLDCNNQKVDLSGASKIRVGLFVKNRIVNKYLDSTLESPISGYGEVLVNTTDNTKLDVYITREQSAAFPLGDMTATVLIETPDVDLDNIAVEYTYPVASVSKGYLKDEDLTI